jgi:hypothetical protein
MHSYDTLTPELVAVVAAVLIVVMVLVVLVVTVVLIPAVKLEPWPTSRGILQVFLGQSAPVALAPWSRFGTHSKEG